MRRRRFRAKAVARSPISPAATRRSGGVAEPDGWDEPELGAFDTEVAAAARARAQHHHPQRFARHLLRSLGQSLPRLRARLLVLLRAAEPRQHGALARARFRDEALRQDQRRPCCSRRNSPRPATKRRRSRWAPTPIPTSRSSASTGRSPAPILEVLAKRRPSRRHRDQVERSCLRDLDLLAPMARQGVWPRWLHLGDDARSATSPGRMEPRASDAGASVGRRSRQLAQAGVPVDRDGARRSFPPSMTRRSRRFSPAPMPRWARARPAT